MQNTQFRESGSKKAKAPKPEYAKAQHHRGTGPPGAGLDLDYRPGRERGTEH